MLVSGKGPAAFADEQYHGLALLDVIAQPLDERSWPWLKCSWLRTSSPLRRRTRATSRRQLFNSLLTADKEDAEGGVYRHGRVGACGWVDYTRRSDSPKMSPHQRLESCLAKNRRFLRSHQSSLDLIPFGLAHQRLDQA